MPTTEDTDVSKERSMNKRELFDAGHYVVSLDFFRANKPESKRKFFLFGCTIDSIVGDETSSKQSPGQKINCFINGTDTMRKDRVKEALACIYGCSSNEITDEVIASSLQDDALLAGVHVEVEVTMNGDWPQVRWIRRLGTGSLPPPPTHADTDSHSSSTESDFMEAWRRNKEEIIKDIRDGLSEDPGAA